MTRWSDKQIVAKKKIGFVPTMGALHEGHLSLVRAAKRENDVVVVSVFVNPIQFGPKEDYSSYPRTLKRDKELLLKEKVDVLFQPSAKSMYPKGYQTVIQVSELSEGLCGAKRKGHFSGVATVVSKLLNQVKSTKAYFGAKDYQQAAVIKQMAQDLNISTDIKVLPTVREKDGLAISSRNKYLNKLERAKAPVINLSLEFAERLVKEGVKSSELIQAEIKEFLKPFVTKLEYVEIVDPKDLSPMKQINSKSLIAIACFIGKTRLIDNRVIG